MFGVQVAVIAVTCLVVIVMLVTSPLWMRALTAIALAIWKQVVRTDGQVVVREPPKDIIEGEFREVEE